MSNGAAIRALRWTPDGGGSNDLQRSDFGFHLEIVLGLDEVAEVRGIDVVVPGLVGQIPRNRIKHRRAIELVGPVQGVGSVESTRRDSYRTLIALLQDIFDPTGYGTLEADTDDGETLSIRARPLSLVFGPEDVPAVRMLSVALESTAPEWTAGGS